MKNIKTLLAIAITSVFIGGSAFAADIELIEPINTENLQIIFSTDVIFPASQVYGNIKILNEFEVQDAKKAPDDKRKITLNLKKELIQNSAYSIISVGEAEGSIEFAIDNSFGAEFKNSNLLGEEKIIERVRVVNPRTIELYYNYDIVGNDEYDFKVLKELKIKDVSSFGDNILNIELETPLEINSIYLAMLSSVENVYGEELDLGSGVLFDFITDGSLSVPEKPLPIVELNASTGEVIEKPEVNTSVEDVAAQTTKIPATGPAEVWIIFIVALLLTGFIFTKGKKA